MADTSGCTSITEVVRTILGATHSGASYEVYSYKKDFSGLWTTVDADGENGYSRSLPQHVFIVWDTTPPDEKYAPIPTENYLSPVEWALCAKSRQSNIVVTILDVNPDMNHTNKICEYARKFRQEQIPWLHMLSVEELLVDPQALVERLIDSFSVSKTPDTSLEDLLRLERLILTETSSDSDRHAISNIVGPIILLGSDYPQDRPHAQPLKTLLKSVKLLAEHDKGDSGTSDATPKLKDLFSGHSINFLLIDDQAHHGWQQWLETMLDGCGTVTSLWENNSANDPADRLFKKLQQAMDKRNGNTDLRFSLSLMDKEEEATERESAETQENASTTRPQQPTALNEILFLDLRLFSGQEVQKEAAFIQQLIPLAKNFTATQSGLAWDGFQADELEDIQTWTANPDRKSAVYFSAITLLPRLIALMDMSYPIVIFSSTGQRPIIEKILPYGNIITTFEKPRFFSFNVCDIKDAIRVGFTLSLAHAFSILEVRTYFNRLSEIKVPKDVCKKYSHIEIYIDESGQSTSSKYCLGGMIVCYDNLADAKCKDKLLKKNGLVWYGDNKLAKNIRRFGDKVACISHTCLKVLGKSQLFCFAFYHPSYDQTPHNDITDIIADNALDNIHMRILRYSLEALIFDIIPILSESETSISLYVGTRQRWFSSEKSTRENQKKLLQRWAIDSMIEDKHLWYKSIRNDFMSVFLCPILSLRKECALPTIMTACGVTLEYGDAPPNIPFRHIHYVADIIANHMSNIADDLSPEALRNTPWNDWTVSDDISPIRERCNERFRHILSASRDSHNGERVLALLKIYLGAREIEDTNASSYERIVIKRIKAELPFLTGKEVMRLTTLISISSAGGLPVYELP